MMAGKFSSLFEAQDMTVGSPTRNLVRFSVPLLIGNLAQQLYSTVDSIVVGNYVGDGALAAIGASGPVINLLLVLFMGVSVGASVMVSQYFGAKERDNLSDTIGTTITATLVCTAFVMILGPLITRPVMSMLDTPGDIYDMACDYMFILFIGFIGSAFFNVISGVLRGLGDSIMPLVFLLAACGMNIGLDIWFVAGFQWGVAGVAWAAVRYPAAAHEGHLYHYSAELVAKSHFCEALGKAWAAQRPDPGNFFLCHDHCAEPDQFLWLLGAGGQYSGYAGRRLLHDAKLYLWLCHDHLYRPEHWRGWIGRKREQSLA